MTVLLRASAGSTSIVAVLLLALQACSSENASLGETDAGSDGPAITPEASIDAAVETDADLPAPPYDFTIACTGQPCVQRIAAHGGAHVCAVDSGGSLRCWGANESGQLGSGATDAAPLPGYAVSPRPVTGIAGATDVAATGRGAHGTTCTIVGGGEVSCFGSNAWGQLGRGVEASGGANPQPVVVASLRAKALSLTDTFALATDTEGRLWSWGENDAFQLARTAGEAGASSSNAPGRADRFAGLVRSAAGTANNGFVVSDGGEILSWGAGTIEQLGRVSSANFDPVPRAIALQGVSTVVAGRAHACALVGGSVRCWGQNERGQLGTGLKAEELLPARVLLPKDIRAAAVAAGGDNTCIIAISGDVYCWGANDSGQTGVADAPTQTTPSRIAGLGERAVQLALMDEAVCALLRNGTVACWGDNLVGQLGRGARDAELHREALPVVFP